jgi:DNA-binding MarR family transcriptional regulator
MSHPPLAAALLAAADWFNEALLDDLAGRGWPRVSRHQSQVFPLLGPDGCSQADLTRHLGITRQSVSTLVQELEALELVERRPDVADRRVKVVALTERGHEFAAEARRLLASAEAELERRIGRVHVDALRTALGAEWGPPPRG